MSAPTEMLFANFNQDFSCVSVGTKGGYSITNCDPYGRVYTQNDGPRGIVEMLFCTSLIALVGAPSSTSSPSATSSPYTASHDASSPRKLQIVNTKRQSMICELLFPASILAVKLNRKTLVIVLETEIYVYDISNMRLLHVVETVPNLNAICALSPSADAPYLAYPAPLPSPALTTSASSSASSPSSGADTTDNSGAHGDVMLFSTRALAPANVVRAHRSPLALMAFSGNGGLLATASVKGTIIRVFATPSLDKLYQFRRGTRETRIHSIAFNPLGSLLAAGGERGTVHLWRVGVSQGKAPSIKDDASSPAESVDGHSLDAGYDAFVNQQERGNSTMGSALKRRSFGLTSTLGKAAASYLPSSLAEMWEPARDFAWLKLPPLAAGTNVAGGERRCVVGLSSTTPHVMVISSDGYFYSYSIDLEKGGECVLVKQYSLL
ncbi:unnamed protein product [Mycena citricolor]|uniref:WD40 repeat-like protein n=1 Tax=Mycena citricolor TaxID=2018698 RepID=A0AAD2H154_9AGAR|nr:unnamed protein product [Mycena citricolor]